MNDKPFFYVGNGKPRYRSTAQPTLLRLYGCNRGAVIPNYSLWTVKALRAKCSSLKLKGRSKAKRKEQLVKMLIKFEKGLK